MTLSTPLFQWILLLSIAAYYFIRLRAASNRLNGNIPVSNKITTTNSSDSSQVLKDVGNPCSQLGDGNNPYGYSVDTKGVQIPNPFHVNTWPAYYVSVTNTNQLPFIVSIDSGDTSQMFTRVTSQGIIMYGSNTLRSPAFKFASGIGNSDNITFYANSDIDVTTTNGFVANAQAYPSDFSFTFNIKEHVIYVSMSSDQNDVNVGQVVFTFAAFDKSTRRLADIANNPASCRFSQGDRNDRLTKYDSFDIILSEQDDAIFGFSFFACAS